MRTRNLKIVFLLALILALSASLLACGTVGSNDPTGIELSLKNWVKALNDKSLTAVAATIYPVDSNEYSAFLDANFQETYFQSFTQPDYSKINLDGFTEVGKNSLYAKWTVSLEIKYTVTLTNSDGTESKLSTTDVFQNSFHFTKRGTEWFFTTEPSPFSGNLPGDGFTLDDTSLPQKTVAFDSNGGSAVAAISTTQGEVIAAPTAPTKDGYTFAGWYTGNNLATQWDFATAVSNDMTLFAAWTKASGSQSATLVSVLGAVDTTVNETNRNVASTFSNATTEFNPTTGLSLSAGASAGLYADRAGTIKLAAPLALNVGQNEFYIIVLSDSGTATRLYTAVFKRNAMYTVSFKETATAATDLAVAKQVEEGHLVALPTATEVTKTGYSLTGWQKDGRAFNAETTIISSDIVLTALWGAQTNLITLNAGSGTISPDSVTVTYDKAYSLGKPSWTGYTFEYWMLEGRPVTDDTGKSLDVWDGNTDSTVNARWHITSYNLLYRLLQDGTNHADNPTTYNINTSYTLKNPTRNGYDFDGWYLSVNETDYTNPITAISPGTTGTLEVFAKWTAKNYNIVFNTNSADSATPASQSVSFTEKITRPADPLKAGQSFIGWYLDNSEYLNQWDFDRSPSGEANTITLYARWTEAFTSGLSFALTANNTYNVHSYDGAATSGILVPATYLGKPVTAIGDGAFRNSAITALSLPASVTKVSVNAFYDCTELTSLSMPGVTDIAKNSLRGVAKLESLVLGSLNRELGMLFGTYSYNDSYAAIGADSISYHIPGTLLSVSYTSAEGNYLPAYSFAGMSTLNSVSLTLAPGTADYGIRPYAFYGCSGLTTLILSGAFTRVTSIGAYAFSGCIDLQTLGSATGIITLPDNLTEIGKYAFAQVSAPVILSDALTNIGEYAFAQYLGTSVTNTDSIISIGQYAFYYATGLNTFGFVSNKVTLFSSASVAIDYIGEGAFGYCRAITEVVFSGASTLYTKIADKSFIGCAALTTINLDDSGNGRIKEIGTQAFEYCTSLATLDLAKVEHVSVSAFCDCAALATVTSGANADKTVTISALAFVRCNAALTEITATNGATISVATNWKG